MKKILVILVFSFACLFLAACTPKEEEKDYVLSLTGETSVEEEEQIQLSANVAGLTGLTFVWKSSNEMVATVVDGLVTGVSVGEATITVSVEGNSKIASV
ncbi:MAG: hypothetical protein GXY04_06050, partial [Acholeplasmataceae bacterium]|nr:hypothetical protein [Acholeplasmataceae bacterium]